MGGWKKEGGWKTLRMTPLPKRGFGPLVRCVFHPPPGVSALFPVQKSSTEQTTEALLEGSKNFRESAFSGTFCTPHIAAQRLRFSHVCVLKTLRFQSLRFRDTKRKTPMRCGGLRSKTQRRQACDLENCIAKTLRFKFLCLRLEGH